jgi:galactose oxidase
MYLFNSDGTRASRPVIELAPEEISYGGHFDIEVAGDPDNISSVVMLRSDHNTHSLTTGDRYVKLSFQPKGAARKSEIRIRAPKVPAQAVPGIYLLYVLDSAGVPSIAKRIDLVN